MTVTKEMIREIMDSYLTGRNCNDKLVIRFEGLAGHVINGIKSSKMYLMNSKEAVIVSHIKQNNGDEDKIEQLMYELKDDYIIARYQDYKKSRYTAEGVCSKKGNEYSIIIPYSSINSLEIIHS